MHQVERAIFDLRRGLPVLIGEASAPLLVQPVESAADTAVATLADRAGSPPALVLSRHRLAWLGHPRATPALLALPPGLEGERLAAVAFGAEPELGVWADALVDADPAERAALALMRRALLIPAALVARVAPARRDAVAAEVADGTLLEVPAEAAARCQETHGLLKRISEARIPLEDAFDSRFILFREPDGLREHVAVVIGEPQAAAGPVPLRLHSACLTGDLFGSLRCDCGEQLRNAVAEIEALGGGVLLYLAQEGRGIGLANKLRAYTRQDAGLDTLDADHSLGFAEDERRYAVAVDMLASLGIHRVQLLTNNPRKVAALTDGGIEVVSRQALYGTLNDHNRRYLSAKAERAGHLLEGVLNGKATRR
ncbi:GTP cyclohydrolase II [Halomonas faecis]|uniref:GTP cyclohydrolase II n=1 Tax=Halomonas faecis TaxID=1562110 RepID=UPI0013D3B1B0|nr:GTP cyclohydrolase II [Halomonas faecis]